MTTPQQPSNKKPYGSQPTTDANGNKSMLALRNAFNQFAGQLSQQVTNPLLEAHGDAYQTVIKADAMRYNNQLEAALEQYKNALALEPDYIEALMGMGKCYRQLGDTENACRVLKQALKQNSFDASIHYELGKSQNESGKLPQAIKSYERALKINPALIDVRFGLALMVELNGDTTYAATLYEQVLDQDDDFLPAYNNLGSIYLRQGDYTEAETFFRELIKRAPDFNRGFLGLAITLDRSGRLRESLMMYQKCINLKPNGHNAEFIEGRMADIQQQLAAEKSQKKQKRSGINRIK
jgi:tetratricopeptide (TPR) repeat protein